ncbi:MAG: extracellular solute-binding protein [Lachnospiraceae bacterium]|nr:extracellular solute-binding protein [Lachnospiraceae bacterium]
MKKKSVIAMMLVASMAAASLLGCGGSKEESQSSADSSEGSSADSGSADSEEKTVIRIWTKDRADANYVQGKIDAYNESNTDNIQVEYEIYTDNFDQAVDLAVQSGELPDILTLNDQVYSQYVNQGQWLDLYEYMDDDMKEYFKDEVYEGINEIDGKLYYIPTCGTTGRLIYNKEIFERVGIENPPATLEEMVEDAKLITSELSGEGIYGFAQNMKSASSALERSLDLGMERESGIKKGYNFATGEYDFTGYEAALGYWQQLLSEECAFPGCESLDIDPLRTQFANGNIGMYISWTHAEPGVYREQFPMDSEKWDAAPIPTVTGEDVGVQNIKFTSGYLINAKSDKVEQAFKVYKEIFASEDFLIGYYEGGYGVSIIPAVVEKANLNEEIADKEWLQMQEIDGVLPLTPQEKNVQAVIVEGEDYYKTFESIYFGGADPASTLKDLTDRYNNALQQGIEDGIGTEIVIEDYDPMNP